MKITTSQAKQATTTFADLSPGDVFYFEDREGLIYLKIHDQPIGDVRHRNAINMNDFINVWFLPNVPVTLLESELVVTYP